MSETTIFCSTNIISYTSIETYSSHVFRGKMTKNEEAKGVMFLSSFFITSAFEAKKRVTIYILYAFWRRENLKKNIEKYHTQQRELQ